ncbi:MAG: GAF domain-containing sensor histidine kinase, partial [Burkholderiales bacterium]|nr:GAF domain-containing sensor histidine kinase [Burkholderiales bacterium]
QEPQKALQAAHAALDLAQQTHNKFEHAETFLTLARLYRQHHLPALPGIDQPNLYYLQQALQYAQDITGHAVSAELLDAMADALAAVNDFEQAYAMARQAASVREKTNSIAATNRAIAMQVQYQTERSQAQNQYHKQLAQAEARRVEVLQQTSQTLSHLSAIGQEVTAHLEAKAIFQALYGHLQGLLEMSSFGIYFVRQTQLDFVFGMEHGAPLPTTSIALDHPTSYAVRCVREGQEILIEPPRADPGHVLSPGSLVSMVCLFAPLKVTGRTIGVMSIQAMRTDAFSERERLIFRTLCAYGAIAFDNAQAYQQLQETKAQLVAQEKLAALGGLVAGVAHELNTPIGNSMLMASALQLKVEATRERLRNQSLRLAQLTEFLADAEQGASLISKSLLTASALVASFKQVAVDRTSEIRREFDLRQTCQELVATMMNQIRQAGHQFSLDMSEGIIMQSYPGPLGQVLGNLISNAVRHAFPNEQKGKMRLFCPPTKAGWVQIRFCDNGCGIPEADLKRIFDPFFTTRMGQGNCGLGLSISHNIVTGLLGGNLRVDSKLMQGTCFILDLPLEVKK